jgi:hypothetical protein
MREIARSPNNMFLVIGYRRYSKGMELTPGDNGEWDFLAEISIHGNMLDCLVALNSCAWVSVIPQTDGS